MLNRYKKTMVRIVSHPSRLFLLLALAIVPLWASGQDTSQDTTPPSGDFTTTTTTTATATQTSSSATTAAPTAAPKIRIGLIGDQTFSTDIQASYGVLQQGVSLLSGKPIDVVLHAGDLTESSNSPAVETALFNQ